MTKRARQCPRCGTLRKDTPREWVPWYGGYLHYREDCDRRLMVRMKLKLRKPGVGA